ncbi:J domain-containing protein [Halolamina litorea]|uniref:J domain-containing protein n=1 Tax=Halolamina litorea TaxID=1515593 RepID=A0ABD6BNN4_9EURY|nr:J domain-containing protein [Halolamina litorea]
MPPQDARVLSTLPSWLLSGLLLGVAASVVIAVVFVLGERYIPDPEPDSSGRRVGAAERQRAEIRAVFRRADEPFLEDYGLGTTRVAFYLPDRDVAITFDPRAYLRLADGETHVVLCEYEMPGSMIGRLLPFDLGIDADRRTASGRDRGRSRSRSRRADRDPWASRERENPIDDAFDTLGLGRDADAEAVSAAYRDQVKEVHPDHGGSQEEFQRLQEAYSTAKEHAD